MFRKNHLGRRFWGKVSEESLGRSLGRFSKDNRKYEREFAPNSLLVRSSLRAEEEVRSWGLLGLDYCEDIIVSFCLLEFESSLGGEKKVGVATLMGRSWFPSFAGLWIEIAK